jgi:DNA-binding CsgD family transcriptional regulator
MASSASLVGRPLVERDAEMRYLTQLVADVHNGAGRTVVVSGPVGCGKSALLGALAQECGTDAVVLRASGGPDEQDTTLGTVGHLLQQAPFDTERRAEVESLLREATEPGKSGQLSGWTAAALCAALFELAATIPLLICVDDVHLVDRESARWLMVLVRRLCVARIVLVLAERTSWRRSPGSFHTRLRHQPHCHQVVLAPLSEQGVAHVVESRLGTGSAARYADVSGGNPMLLHALLDDSHGTGGELGSGAVHAFPQAVVDCLHRGQYPALEVARGIAVLDHACSEHLLEELLDLPPTSVAGTVRDLESAGLLADGRFRHPAVRWAVLSDMAPADLSRCRHRAAHLRYLHGAPDREIADLLLAAGSLPEDVPRDVWRVDVLRSAVREAVSDGDIDRARRYAETALMSCVDGHQRGLVRLLQAGIEWQAQPGNAVRHLSPLTGALFAGELSEQDAIEVVTYLLRHGQVTAAGRALRYLQVRHQPATAGLRQLLAGSYPGLLRQLPADEALADRSADRTADGPALRVPAWVRADPRLPMATALADVLAGQANKHTLLGAEQVLRTTSLRHGSWEEVECALLALIYADEAARAEAACDRLLERIDTTTRGWQPPLFALRAHIAQRRGRPAQAEWYASAALRDMPREAWGVALGTPLAALLAAHTALDRQGSVAGPLSCPVPPQIYQSRHGLHYLHARGEYRLASGNPQAAVADFLICGELMREWNLDLPSLVPWRSAAAQAHLRLGQRQQARKLVEEQLTLVRPGPSRTRGLTMRIAAATSDLKDRPTLLRQALDDLTDCDDRLEMAATLADLGHAYQGLGDEQLSRAMTKRAWHQARSCGAEALCGDLSGSVTGAQHVPAGDAVQDGLSDAERRVALLAALGHTNREISQRLVVTVSTVEQHLTRVYRKLGVNRRADLLDRLGGRAAPDGFRAG